MNYSILCSSYFDPLGHPIFAEKIANNINLIYKDSKIDVYGVELQNKEIKEQKSNINFVPIKIPIFGKYYNIETRRYLSKNLSFIGILISYFIRFIVVTIFYVKVYKKINQEPFIDLEYEPIQEFIGSLFLSKKSRQHMIIHNFPRSPRFSFKSLYKRISINFYKLSLIRFPKRKICLMNEENIDNAIQQNISIKKIILAGWGYDLKDKEIKKNIINDSEITLLAFGIMRQDKRIDQLVNLFLSLDSSKIILNMIGRSLDVDIEYLKKEVSLSSSRTQINIEDTFIEDDQVNSLIEANDIMVLSHSSSFESMSGPMLLAIENNKPILCFSSNTVAKLVKSTKSGIVVDMDKVNHKELFNEIENLSKLKYDANSIKRYQWKEITKRLMNFTD